MNARDVAARATSAKWGGKSPDVRDLARDLLEVLAELEAAQATIARLECALEREVERDADL